MGLEVADCAGINTGALQRLTDEVALRSRAGNRVTIGLATVVDCGSLDDGMYDVAIRDRSPQRLQQDCGDPFAGSESTGIGPEAVASSISGTHLKTPLLNELVGMKRQVHSTSNGQRALATTKALNCQVDASQGGRTHRVNRHTWTMEVKEIRDAICDTRWT